MKTKHTLKSIPRISRNGLCVSCKKSRPNNKPCECGFEKISNYVKTIKFFNCSYKQIGIREMAHTDENFKELDYEHFYEIYTCYKNGNPNLVIIDTNDLTYATLVFFKLTGLNDFEWNWC